MASLTCSKLALWTITAVLLQIIGLCLFVLGFFPVKPALTGVSGPESYTFPKCGSAAGHAEEAENLPPERLRSLYEELSGIPPSFDKLILMVVDGLPAEFVLGKNGLPAVKEMKEAMPYTQSLLLNQRAVGYHAKAGPPTVTMPRLKAIVSGAIGGFLDVAFNFNTQKLMDDNLLGQFANIGWKMVMHGDETWIKMFPELFARHDGVSSFFVKDTIQVDQNVSRHLDTELLCNDWNLLILHYLGLDHVGHIGGRHSALMAPKLREMDEVVRMIYLTTILPDSNSGKDTLLVIVSDHGMTESGNHGGSSYEETDSLALFIGLDSDRASHAFVAQNTAFQVDMTPTLALLFSVPVPKNSVGVLIPGVLDHLTEEQQLRAIELNSWQLVRLLQVQLPDLFCGNSPCMGFNYELGLEVIRLGNVGSLHDVILAYHHFARAAAEWLSSRVTDKPLGLLAGGICVMFISCLIFMILLFKLSRQVGVGQTLSSSNSENSHLQWHLDEAFVLFAVLTHVLSLGASSMVEEEQYIWHFLTSTLFIIFLRKSFQSDLVGTLSNSCNSDRYFRSLCIIVILICGRILRGWHQGGVNWTHLPDISKWFEHLGPFSVQCLQTASLLLITGLGLFTLHKIKSLKVLVILVEVSLFISGILLLLHFLECGGNTSGLSSYSATSIAQSIYVILGLIASVITFAAPWTAPISFAQASEVNQCLATSSTELQLKYVLVGIREVSDLIGRTFVVCWCLLQLLLQHPVNSAPIALLFLQILVSMKFLSAEWASHKRWVEIAAMFFLGMAGHFGLGNSNSLATIDVAGAFIGISSHSTVLSGILLFVNTYASPLLFLLCLVMYTPLNEKYLFDSKSSELGNYLKVKIGMPCLVPLALNSVILIVFTIILMLMQSHLFVWSVFSPKYLYVAAATISIYIGVIILAMTEAYTCLVFLVRMKMVLSKARARDKCS